MTWEYDEIRQCFFSDFLGGTYRVSPWGPNLWKAEVYYRWRYRTLVFDAEKCEAVEACERHHKEAICS